MILEQATDVIINCTALQAFTHEYLQVLTSRIACIIGYLKNSLSQSLLLRQLV